MRNTPVLDDHGHATNASGFVASHYAFRRDAARFPVAVRRITADDDRLAAFREHWSGYHEGLHQHHVMEDDVLFPWILGVDSSLQAVIDQLVHEHHDLDEVLSRIDEALPRLPNADAVDAAAAAFEDLATALDGHLDLEEERIVPVLLSNELPLGPPPDTDFSFAAPWMVDDVEPSVSDALFSEAPPPLKANIDGWTKTYEDRLRRWWS